MKRIFMLSSHPLFSQGVESLLRRETGLEIVGREADADQALERIKELQPDVVVLDSADLRDPMPVVMRIFREGVGAKVISLNLKDNTMHVYRGEQRVVKQVEDLVKVIKAEASEGVENTAKKFRDVTSGASGYRLVLYKILQFCETPRSATEVEEKVRSFPEMQTAIYPPIILLGWLEKIGGIERMVVEEEEERWQTTEAGKRVAAREALAKRLLELLAQEPVYQDIYMQVLRFCQTPRARAEIEELLEGNPVMEKPKVYPTFFIQGLEEAGGLEWVGKWQTTEAGKGVLA
ncbi:MAG: response regulator transcription factor [Chloroflexi bacterium]|nr:response regulator transcription factor [Chloroflexota bacterium]